MLADEARNREAITVLCLDFVPEKFHVFIINYIVRKLVSLIGQNRIHKRNIMFIREAATFFKATDESVMEPRFKVFRHNLTHYMRMGRSGTYFMADTQSYSEVKGIVQGADDMFIMFRNTSFKDKVDMCDPLKRDRLMRQDQISDLSFLEKGEAYVKELSKVVKKIKFTLPRSAYWEKKYGNFFRTVWDRFGGEWKNTQEIKDYIDNKIKECDERYKEVRKKELEKKANDERLKKMSKVLDKTKKVETSPTISSSAKRIFPKLRPLPK
jgi:hypothetical protein